LPVSRTQLISIASFLRRANGIGRAGGRPAAGIVSKHQ
jgi:hypothetical protein